ncbi:unnamed protein product [Penicillium roqueforti FM164]|uniref:Genomic scaffold, ProqFM164S04 n=1 Tax=Penicillium roqueforti (strain FM164) TaxID=1365484 RepID=W6QHL3_PENRF|nr:unnamed protein product [Penicillium roqueforti FM164]
MAQHGINPELLPIRISARALTPTPNTSHLDLLYSIVEATIQDVQTRSEAHPDLIIITDITTQEGQQLWDVLDEISSRTGSESASIRTLEP